jgi:hypothetical protein
MSAQERPCRCRRLIRRCRKIVNATRPNLSPRAGFDLRAGLLQAAASYLGVTVQQLQAELKSHQTLAQIATANGKTAAGLEQALVAAVKARLDQAVAAGKLSAAREQAILAKVANGIAMLVEHTR